MGKGGVYHEKWQGNGQRDLKRVIGEEDFLLARG